jgi:uncharacterized delta-60 repeat protein
MGLRKIKTLLVLVVFLNSHSLLAYILFDPAYPQPVGYEQTGKAEVYLLRKGDLSAPVTLNYEIRTGGSLAKDDFVAPSGQFLFPSGKTNFTFVIDIKRDGLVEGYEYFDFMITGMDGDQFSGAAKANLTIIDGETVVRSDPSFHPYAVSMNGIRDAVKLSDGSIVVASLFGWEKGHAITVKKLKPNGELDRTLRFDPSLYVNSLPGAYLNLDGSMFFGGDIGVHGESRQVVKLGSNGQLDPSFATPPAETAFVGFQPDGRAILQQGTNILRLDRAGLPDPTFTFGLTPAFISKACVEEDASLFVVWNAAFEPTPSLTHVMADGEVDESFRPIGGGIGDVIISADSIYVTGTFPDSGQGLRKLSSTGETLGFTAVSGVLPKLRLAADGKVWMGDARYNSDLTMDRSFAASGENVVLDNGDGTVLVTPYWGAGGLSELDRIYSTNRDLTQIEFSAPSFSIMEGSSGSVSLRRIGRTAEALSVTIAATPLNGTAAEFSPASGMVQFAPLQEEGWLTFVIRENDFPEHDRSVRLSMVEHGTASLGRNATATLRIVDDDSRPGSFAIAASPSTWQLTAATNTVIMQDIKQHPSGQILVSGRFGQELTYGAEVVLFDSPGLRKTNFAPFPALLYPHGLGIQSSGQIVVAGEHGFGGDVIARLNLDGIYDRDFRATGLFGHSIEHMAIQSDDKILVSGYITDREKPQNFLRLLANGPLDPDFIPAPQVTWVGLIAVQRDGKIIVDCNSTLATDVRVLRLNKDGSLDLDFAPIRNAWKPSALAVQNDGQILVAFFEEDVEWEETHGILIRADPHGLVDSTFQPPSFSGTIAKILPLANGQILIGGTFAISEQPRRSGLALLNADGSVDESFDPGSAAAVNAMLILDNGDLLAGGNFNSFNGITCSGLVELKMGLPPGLRSAAVGGGEFTARLVGSPGKTIRVESSSDLRNWTSLTTVTLSDYSRPFSAPATEKRNFYRMRAP